jgi:hypothetical protein
LFSQRHQLQPSQYRYQFDERIRRRLFNTLAHSLENDPHASLDQVLLEVGKRIIRRYGGFRSSGYEAARISDDPVIEHFFYCRDEELMDFLVFCFETPMRCGGQKAVDAINEVLNDEYMAYQLTAFIEIGDQKLTPARLFGGGRSEVIPPRAVQRDEMQMHKTVIEPALQALADPRFATANSELLNAFDEWRQRKYADAITDAAAAFETVIKTVLTHKKWPYDKDKDACAVLVEHCRKNGLVLPFYAEILKSVGTIRNKVGDAHGGGPAPEYKATKELADHMIATVCANINLLISLAKL